LKNVTGFVPVFHGKIVWLDVRVLERGYVEMFGVDDASFV
jgi:hypothetical protein